MTSLSVRWDLAPYNAMTMLTSMFLHGGVLHLAGNMLYLWIFGNNVEDAMGHGRFVIFYLLSGIVAAIVQFLYDLSGCAFGSGNIEKSGGRHTTSEFCHQRNVRIVGRALLRPG